MSGKGRSSGRIALGRLANAGTTEKRAAGRRGYSGPSGVPWARSRAFITVEAV